MNFDIITIKLLPGNLIRLLIGVNVVPSDISVIP